MRAPARERPSADEGSSPVTAVFGAAMMLFMLLMASQTLLHLYATSVITSAAFDTANQVAAEGRDCGPGGQTAMRIAAGRLGAYAARPGVEIVCDDSGGLTTSVTIRAPSPARALSTLTYGSALGEIERTAVVRTEQVR